MAKSKKDRSSQSLQKLEVKNLLLEQPNVQNKNNSIHHVLCAILYPSHSKSQGCQNGKARESCHPQPQCAAAVRCDQRGASLGNGQSWHELQCFQEAQYNGYSEEHPGKAVRQWWRSRLISDICAQHFMKFCKM